MPEPASEGNSLSPGQPPPADARFRYLVEQQVDGLVVVDLEGVVRYANPAAVDLVGRADLVGQPFGFSVPTAGEVEIGIDRPDGSRATAEMHAVRVEWEGEHACLVSLHSTTDRTLHEVYREGCVSRTYDDAQDLTEHREVEERVRASLREREILLREVHHRVKNNLQVISSLLRMQGRELEGQVPPGIFADSQNRVRSMALVHELLYSSSDLAAIDFAAYVQIIGRDMLELYAGATPRLHLDTRQVESLLLGLETAIPCGLIVCELVSNALKHAFPSDRRGTIRVAFSRQDDSYRLAVEDDGVGLPVDLDVRHTSSLGLRLVRLLAEQLEGELEVRSHPSATFVITFPARRQP